MMLLLLLFTFIPRLGIEGLTGQSGQVGPATSALIGTIYGLVGSATGELFLADFANNCIRRVNGITGTISTFAGEFCWYCARGSYLFRLPGYLRKLLH